MNACTIPFRPKDMKWTFSVKLTTRTLDYDFEIWTDKLLKYHIIYYHFEPILQMLKLTKMLLFHTIYDAIKYIYILFSSYQNWKSTEQLACAKFYWKNVIWLRIEWYEKNKRKRVLQIEYDLRESNFKKNSYSSGFVKNFQGILHFAKILSAFFPLESKLFESRRRYEKI